jgi:predicted short-subunit dehydrogenase-like oxidoreductase (DUF2520 family)
VAAVGIIGAGRAGLGLGLALARAGHEVRLHARHARPVPPPLSLSVGGLPAWLSQVDVVLLAVPDDAITDVACALGAAHLIKPTQTVLHLSGALGRDVLTPLAPSGAALGSFHPLQSLSDPATAPQRLSGAMAAVEGDERAIVVATALARGLGMDPVRLAGADKPAYHAAAVVAANFLVTLAATSQRLFVRAGLPPDGATRALAALMQGALDNVRATGPAAALTGPVARGDVETIRRHLAALDGADAALYRALSRAALALSDLDAERRLAVAEVLGEA